MKILLLVSGVNGLTQRVWCALDRAGHDVNVHVAERQDEMRAAAREIEPDLILCPYLKAKVPEDVWRTWTTIIVHPGPVGDRGSSSLDWAMTNAEPAWGVTALQAVDEFDAGPIWAYRTFPMPNPPQRKSTVYNSLVSDAALQCVEEVITKAGDPSFTPTPLTHANRPVPSARLRPSMTSAGRAFSWEDPTHHIVRRIRAADGSPGAPSKLLGTPVRVYDAHLGSSGELRDHPKSRPGHVLCHDSGGLHVRTGDGIVWIGHLATEVEPGRPGIKLPATTSLQDRLADVPHAPHGHRREQSQISYRRSSEIGWLTFDFYNGAMSTYHCRRLLTALRHATSQDTRALVLQGSLDTFSNGIHLNVIEASDDPAAEAWSNIKAMNAICKQIITCRPMKVIAAFSGNAGAGGVMLALGADVVAARDGVILNPYYDMGLFGSEMHTYTLPRRVGSEAASRLLSRRHPVDTKQALSMGLIDAVGPRDPGTFQLWLGDLASYHAANDPKPAPLSTLLPLDAIEIRELAEMSRDMFDDRSGFSEARHAFVHKTPKPVAKAATR